MKNDFFDWVSDQRESDHSWHLSLVMHMAAMENIVIYVADWQ
jgi:hypothetical protein